MVHALLECWRVLIPDGVLVDLRPLCGEWPLEVVTTERAITVGPADGSVGTRVDQAANDAIEDISRQGWFVREHSETFTLYIYWDALDEMRTFVEEKWAPDIVLPEDLYRRARKIIRAEATMRLRVRLDMLMSRYRKRIP